MHLFFTPDIDSSTYTLNEDESKHCVRVLRLQEDDTLALVDGKGTYYEAKIIEAHSKKCVLQITKTHLEFGKLSTSIHLAIAPTKNMDRMEWLVEKCTEIGINTFSLIACDHSERRHSKDERLVKIAISAMKQSLKAYLPTINPLVNFEKFVSTCECDLKFIAHCAGERILLSKQNLKGKSVCILIGPEGDFSSNEIEFAHHNGFVSVSLGESRLRTETAGLVAVQTITLLNEI